MADLQMIEQAMLNRPETKVKLKKLTKKYAGKPWNLYIDTSTTKKYLDSGNDYDVRDKTAGTLSEEDIKKMDNAARRLHRDDCGCGEIPTPGYWGWDRDYVGEDLLLWTYYFETAEHAFEYYKYMKSDINQQYPVVESFFANNITRSSHLATVWYLTDNDDKVLKIYTGE